jgi:hypothetical protein
MNKMKSLKTVGGINRRGVKMLSGRAPAPTTSGSHLDNPLGTNEPASELPPPTDAQIKELGGYVDGDFTNAELSKYLKTSWGVDKCKEKEAARVLQAAQSYSWTFKNEMSMQLLKQELNRLVKCNSPQPITTVADSKPPAITPVAPAGANAPVNAPADNTYTPPPVQQGGTAPAAAAGVVKQPAVDSTNTALIAGVVILIAAILLMQYTRS